MLVLISVGETDRNVVHANSQHLGIFDEHLGDLIQRFATALHLHHHRIENHFGPSERRIVGRAQKRLPGLARPIRIDIKLVCRFFMQSFMRVSTACSSNLPSGSSSASLFFATISCVNEPPDARLECLTFFCEISADPRQRRGELVVPSSPTQHADSVNQAHSGETKFACRSLDLGW